MINSGGKKLKLNFGGKKKLSINPNKIKINKSVINDPDNSMYYTREESKTESEFDISIKKLTNEINILQEQKEILKSKLQSYAEELRSGGEHLHDESFKQN